MPIPKLKNYVPCCGDTQTFKNGTLPMGSCDLHMLAPEMLELLREALKRGQFAFNGKEDAYRIDERIANLLAKIEKGI